MSAQKYFAAAAEALEQVRERQLPTIQAAAAELVRAIHEDRAIYSFGATHSFMLTEELVYRTGGLMLVNPIYPHGMNLFVRPMPNTSRIERLPGLGIELLNTVPIAAGDVLLIASTSGRNAVGIDMAIAARDRGVTVIGITSMAYTDGVTSRHPSGKKLKDCCDLVLDNGAPHGDACVTIDGFPQPVAPLSTLTGVAIVNALVAEVVQRLVDLGEAPPVYMSANLDGGDEHNRRLLDANRHRIHYLE